MDEREHLDLSGLWRWSPDPHGDGEELGFWQPGYQAGRWREVTVPSVFEAACPDIDFYEGICWYRRALSVPAAWQGRRIVLRFEGVNYRARVWLNGTDLGENMDGFLPFEFEIGEQVRWDGENLLVVSVDNAHHAGDVPGMHTGWRGDGGILREVGLEATNECHIRRLRIVATPQAGGGAVILQAWVHNAGPAPVEGSLEVTLYDADGRAISVLPAEPAQLAAGSTAEVTCRGTLAGARPWSPSQPVLYRASARLKAGGATVDGLDVRFGFRRIEATPDGLRLNGEPIFLTGWNRHEDSPRTAMATDLALARLDLEQMKEAGANFVRLCHYPHHPGELDLCDELGLLAFGEIPLYFWNDREEGRATQALRAESAARQLERMIERDANHPSLIFWSVSNETSDDETAVAEDNRALIRRARALDPTRLCVHVSNHWREAPNFAEDDVICINGYPAIDWQARGHKPGSDLGYAAEWWRSGLAELRRQYPSKPILITEFGYFSFAGTFGNSFGEDEAVRVLEVEFPALNDVPYVCGTTIWCWADHSWPAARFLGVLAVSPHGVLSRQRQAKQPFWTARALFRARQGLETLPRPPETQSTTDAGL